MPKNIQKLGIVIKTSDSHHPPKDLHPGIFPDGKDGKLFSVSHYHQRPGCHPDPVRFEDRDQCVELITGGRGWLKVEGDWKELGPGDLLWHIPGDVTVGRSDFSKPYSCLAVRFQEGAARRRRVPRITRWEELDEVRLFTRQVVHLHADGAFDSRVLLRYILGRLHFQAELYLRIQRERGLPVELQRVLEVVSRRYAERLGLMELAAGAGWSVPHLHDRFKKCLGISPHQALIRRRIQVARELLASTNDPIKVVAGKCGFPTASAFCVQFKKAVQLSPQEYRKRQLFGER